MLFRKQRRALAWLHVEFYRVQPKPARGLNEPGRRIDIAGRANRHKHICLGQFGVDTLHPIGDFPEPNDVGTGRRGRAFGACLPRCHRKRRAPTVFACSAKGTVQLPVHMEDLL